MAAAEIVNQVYATGYSTKEIDADRAEFAKFLDLVISKVDDIKAKCVTLNATQVAYDQVIRGYARKTWGGNEKSYMLTDRMLTVNASTLNRIIDLVNAEVAKAF